MASTSSRIIKNTIYLYLKTIISMLVMLYTTRIVLQTLGVIDYGIYNVVAGSIAILGFFRNSLAVTMQRFLNHYQGEGNLEKQKIVFNIGILFHWLIAFILVFLFVLLALFLFNGILNIPEDRLFAAKIVYVCLITNTFLTVVTAPYDAAITAHENMLFYSIVGITESLLKLLVAITIIYVGNDKLILYALLMMVVPFFEMITMRIYCHNNYEECSFHPKKYLEKGTMSEMGGFAGWSLIGTTTSLISNHGANLVLNHFFGVAINAVAGIANQIQGLLAVVFTSLIKSMTPVIFKSEGERNIQSMMDYSLMGCKYSTFLYLLIAVPVFIETPYLLNLWLVDVPEWCVLFVRLQLLRALLEQLGASLQNSLNATNHIKEFNIISSFYNLIPIMILIFLYSCGFQPYWHFIVMITIMTMGRNFTLLKLCKKYCGLTLQLYLRKVLYPCALVMTITPIIGLGISNSTNGIVGLILCTIVTAITSIFLFYVTLDGIEKEKVQLIWQKSKDMLYSTINNKK